MSSWLRIAFVTVLAALPLCLISSCASAPSGGAVKTGAPLPPRAIPLVNALQKRERSFLSLRSLAYATVDTMRGRQSANIALILQSPRYMRIEFVTPAGVATASFASDGRTYQYLDLDKQQFITDKLTKDTLKETLGLVIDYDDLWEALAGQIPFPGKSLKKVESEGERLHAITETRPGYEARHIYDLSGNLPLERIESDESGIDLTLLRFEGFHDVSGYALPRSFIFANSFAKVTFQYLNVVVNDVVNEDAFYLTPPWDTH